MIFDPDRPEKWRIEDIDTLISLTNHAGFSMFLTLLNTRIQAHYSELVNLTCNRREADQARGAIVELSEILNFRLKLDAMKNRVLEIQKDTANAPND